MDTIQYKTTRHTTVTRKAIPAAAPKLAEPEIKRKKNTILQIIPCHLPNFADLVFIEARVTRDTLSALQSVLALAE